MRLVRAAAAFVSGLADTGDRGQRTVEQANDRAELNSTGRLGEGIATVLASFGVDITGDAQLGQDLLTCRMGRPSSRAIPRSISARSAYSLRFERFISPGCQSPLGSRDRTDRFSR